MGEVHVMVTTSIMLIRFAVDPHSSHRVDVCGWHHLPNLFSSTTAKWYLRMYDNPVLTIFRQLLARKLNKCSLTVFRQRRQIVRR